MPTDISPLAYTIKAAQQASGASHRKIYEAINAGTLKARKNGKRTILLHTDLMSWLDSLPEYEPRRAA